MTPCTRFHDVRFNISFQLKTLGVWVPVFAGTT